MVHKIDTTDMIPRIDMCVSGRINWIIIQIGLILHASNEPKFIRVVYKSEKNPRFKSRTHATLQSCYSENTKNVSTLKDVSKETV